MDIQPAKNAFVEDRSFAVVVCASDAHAYDHYYQNGASNAAPEDYLDASKTISTPAIVYRVAKAIYSTVPWLATSTMVLITLTKIWRNKCAFINVRPEHPRMRAFSYTRLHFWSREKDGGHTYSIRRIVQSPMLHSDFTGLCFTERELLQIGVLHCRNRNFRPFWLL